jgi:protein-disulfide isomerase
MMKKIQKTKMSLTEMANKPHLIVVIPLMLLMFVNGFLWMKVNSLEAKIVNGVAAPNALGDQAAGAAAEPKMNLDAIKAVGKDDYIRGSADADFVLVEYSDYECPFCQRFHDVMKQVMKEYGNKIAWVYRHYPLPFHQNAQMESEAAECVGELGGFEKFWQYSDSIYEKTTSTGTSVTNDQMAEMAVSVGVDKAKFVSCLDSGKYTDKVNAQLQDGSAAGIQGTPGTIIIAKNGQKEFIPGALPFEEVKALIDGMK